MSVPLDRLYNYLHDIVNHDILIYRWTPHGSKKLEDLRPLLDYKNLNSTPILIAHDQEPLDYYQYTINDVLALQAHVALFDPALANIPPNKLWDQFQLHHFRLCYTDNIYKLILLAHSERNSDQVELYQSKGYIPVYYWSHAIIARDWYRYAEHDPNLIRRTVKTPFLIYNRAWSGTREYRLKFAEMLVNAGLDKQCQMGFNILDQEQEYYAHVFKNAKLQITTTDLDKHFFTNTATSDASADYCAQDYRETMIEVVLETLFDDTRWHLTEKTLRTIACGHPFILAATPGSLEYLRSYGFETFGGLIDETYDTIQDPVQRLDAIIQVMQQLLTADAKVWEQLRSIAARNKTRFFSPEFHQQIVDEFKLNFDQAFLRIIPSQSSAGGSAI